MERIVVTFIEMESSKEPLKGSYRKIDPQSLRPEEFQIAPVYKAKEIVKTVWPEHREELLINPDGQDRKVVANWGDRLITYESGHTELIPGPEVSRRLRPTMEKDVYEVDMWVKAIPNKFNEKISLIAPPKGFQIGEPDCWIAVRYFPDSDKIATTPYLISSGRAKKYSAALPMHEGEVAA